MHRSLIYSVACAVCICAFYITLCAWAASAMAEPSKATCKILDCTNPEPPCYEDEPCFKWSKMGNRKRGVIVVTPKGNLAYRVVGPCGFQRKWYNGAIRYTAAHPRLPGDRWAKLYGCGLTARSY